MAHKTIHNFFSYAMNMHVIFSTLMAENNAVQVITKSLMKVSLNNKLKFFVNKNVHYGVRCEAGKLWTGRR